jgi:hypothetical protein
MTQRMFHGTLAAAALADQLAARFNDRQHRTYVAHGDGTALIQIGSKHGTPVTANIADTEGGVLVTLSRGRDWLDKAGDVGELIARAAAGSPLALLALVPDVIGELQKDNLAPAIWEAVADICALSQALAGEKDAPQNPTICEYCLVANPPSEERCLACGAPLPVTLPNRCPDCGKLYTAAALFCQACGSRLVKSS